MLSLLEIDFLATAVATAGEAAAAAATAETEAMAATSVSVYDAAAEGTRGGRLDREERDIVDGPALLCDLTWPML